MSFMCRENYKGPRTVPCGTPDTTGAQSDLTVALSRDGGGGGGLGSNTVL